MKSQALGLEPSKKKKDHHKKVKPKPVNHLVGRFMIGMANQGHAHNYLQEEASLEEPVDTSDEG